jgi:hypothetical protein
LVQVTAKIEALVVSFLFLIFGLGLGQVVISTIQGYDTNGWNFTGHEAIETLLPLFPIIYYMTIILGFLGIVFVAVTRMD